MPLDFYLMCLVFFIFSKNLTWLIWNTTANWLITLLYLWKIVRLDQNLFAKLYTSLVRWLELWRTFWKAIYIADYLFSNWNSILIKFDTLELRNSLGYDILEFDDFQILLLDPFVTFCLSCGFNQGPRVRLEEFLAKFSYYSQVQSAYDSLITHPWCCLLGERVWKVTYLLTHLLFRDFNSFIINTIHQYHLHYFSYWYTIMWHQWQLARLLSQIKISDFKVDKLRAWEHIQVELLANRLKFVAGFYYNLSTLVLLFVVTADKILECPVLLLTLAFKRE